MMHVSAILLAAGRGLRLKSDVSKPFVKIASKPLIIYSLKTLSSHPDIKDIVVVVNQANKAEALRQVARYRMPKVRRVVIGGRRRQDSVENGLKALDSRADLVLIHDAARPFIDKAAVSSVIKEAAQSGSAITGVPVKATIKSVVRSQNSGVRVKETLKRNGLWEIQTPQVFRKGIILDAYKKFAQAAEVTDDSALVERLGARVRVVWGSYNNIKITTPEDLVLAEAIAKKWNTG